MTVGRRIMSLLLVLFVVLVQVSIVEQIAIAQSSPSIIVLFVVSLALLTDSVWGAIYGFSAGLAIGLFAALPLIGPHALVFTIIGYWSGRWGEQIVADDHPLPPLIAGIAGTLTLQFGIQLVDFLLSFTAGSTHGTVVQPAIVTLLNAVLAIPVYMLVRQWFTAPIGSPSNEAMGEL